MLLVSVWFVSFPEIEYRFSPALWIKWRYFAHCDQLRCNSRLWLGFNFQKAMELARYATHSSTLVIQRTERVSRKKEQWHNNESKNKWIITKFMFRSSDWIGILSYHNLALVPFKNTRTQEHRNTGILSINWTRIDFSFHRFFLKHPNQI